jgi:ABC-type Fe3+-siderophore transport system permease subunit
MAQRRRLLLLALIPMSCDLLENALGIGLVSTFPARFDALAWLATSITALKWASLALAHLVMVYALVAACRSAFRRDPRRNHQQG